MMFFKTTLFLLAWTGASASVEPLRRDKRNLDENQVVDGTEVQPGEYPYFASLEVFDEAFSCGGTLLDSTHVLTAAHCFIKDNGNFYQPYPTVRIGHTTYSGGEQVAIDCVAVHPDYTEDFLVYADIAVVKLASPATTTSFATLNSDISYPSNDGDPLTVIGFGYTDDDFTEPDVLLKQTEGFLPAPVCAQTNGDCTSSAHVICTSADFGGACQGDSGGPIFDANDVQVGITSYGGACKAIEPDVYANVASYKDWIDEQVASTTCTTSFTASDTFSGPCPAPVPPGPTISPVSTDAPTSSPTEEGSPSCFSEVTTIEVQGQGSVMMKDLKVHDKIYTGNKGNSPQHQEVYAFGHLDTSSPTEYLQFYTTQSHTAPLEISPAHLMHIRGKLDPVRADSVKPGDVLLYKTLDAPTQEVFVTKVERITRKGAYMPLTKDGSIVVNGIQASTYVSISDNAPAIVGKFQSVLGLSDHDILHWWTSPYRLVCTASPKLCENDYNDEGIASWLMLGKYLIQVFDSWGSTAQLVGVTTITIALAASLALEALVGSWFGLMLLGLLSMGTMKGAMLKKKVE